MNQNLSYSWTDQTTPSWTQEYAKAPGRASLIQRILGIIPQHDVIKVKYLLPNGWNDYTYPGTTATYAPIIVGDSPAPLFDDLYPNRITC